MNLDNEMFYLTEHEIDCLDELSVREIYEVYTCVKNDFNIHFVTCLEAYIGERVMYEVYLKVEHS